MTFPDNAIPLEACATEDSENCFWDAAHNGNGTGQSFLNYDGYTVLLNGPKGYHIDTVLVDPDGLFQDPYAANPGYGVVWWEDAAPSATPTPTETTTATAQPTETPDAGGFDLAGTGLNFAPLGIVVAAAIAVAVIGLSLIGWHNWKTKKESER